MWKILINVFNVGHNFIKMYLNSVTLKDFTTYFVLSGHDHLVIFVGEETAFDLHGTWFLKMYILVAISFHILRNFICF
jgi:hypothetical protein